MRYCCCGGRLKLDVHLDVHTLVRCTSNKAQQANKASLGKLIQYITVEDGEENEVEGEKGREVL